MKLDWNSDKNQILIERYGVGFEDVAAAVENGRVLDVRKHPNRERYPNQEQMILEIDNYAYVVPYVDDGDVAFLKTLYPSRKATAKYLTTGLN